MKRKLDDFFLKPTKKLKTKFLSCQKCNREIFHSLFDVHDCENTEKKSKKPEILTHPLLLSIMRTCQQDISANLNIEYEGKIENRHKWKYSFDDPCGKVSKPHFLTLSKTDPRKIRLTFATSHKGRTISYVSCSVNNKFSIAEFKSLLQKAIRRGNRRSAVKTALQFACNFG